MIRGKLWQIVPGEDEREFVLENETVTIGRASDNDIVLPHPTVSRHHARIVFRPDAVIEDVGSTLGTIVGGEKIKAGYPLHSGDIIILGDLRLRFESPQLEDTVEQPVANVAAPVQREAERPAVAAPGAPAYSAPAPQTRPEAKRATGTTPPTRPVGVSVVSRFLSILHQHTVRALAILFFVGMLLILANLYNLAQKINEDAAVQYAAVFVRSLDKFRTLYGSDVVTRVQNHGILVTADYKNHEGAIPIPSTLGIEISEQISESGSGIHARLYSDFPYPTRKDGGPRSDFETEALVRLRVQADKTIPYYQFESVDGRRSLQFAQAVIMAESCVNCHNADPVSPKRDWKVGDVGGIQEVVLPIDSAFTTIRKGLFSTLGVMLVITLTGLGLLAFVLSALRSSIQTLSRTNAAYSRFVPQEFLSLLGKQSIIDVALADNVQMEMTVLFSDIRSFTTISESMDPQANFQFLSDFMSKMGPLVRENHGFIDKYIGDATMALFENPDDAVDAAIALLHQLVEYNATRQEQRLLPIDIGIGLNTGRVMVGTLGERDRMDGTVISDAVNLASRLEGLTKMYRVPLLISERTFRGIRDVNRYSTRLLDHVRVKGKSEAVTIYEVFNGDPAPIREKKLATKRDFERAIGLYQLKQFQDAKKLFEKCHAASPDDQVAAFYIERCTHLIDVGVEEDWDGVLNLESK